MAYSSVNAMLNVSRQNNQPLWDVILRSRSPRPAVDWRLSGPGDGRSPENRRMQRLHETNCRRAHGGQLRRSARGAAALVAQR